MKTTKITYTDRYKIITKVLTDENMHHVLYSLYHKQLKHTNRYTIYYYNCISGIHILSTKLFDKEPYMIPYKIVYERTYDFIRWKRYRDAKDLTCQTCKHYTKWTVNSMTTVIHLCNKVPTHVLVMNSPTLESDQMLPRHPECPFVYESIHYQLG